MNKTSFFYSNHFSKCSFFGTIGTNLSILLAICENNISKLARITNVISKNMKYIELACSSIQQIFREYFPILCDENTQAQNVSLTHSGLVEVVVNRL